MDRSTASYSGTPVAASRNNGIKLSHKQRFSPSQASRCKTAMAQVRSHDDRRPLRYDANSVWVCNSALIIPAGRPILARCNRKYTLKPNWTELKLVSRIDLRRGRVACLGSVAVHAEFRHESGVALHMTSRSHTYKYAVLGGLIEDPPSSSLPSRP